MPFVNLFREHKMNMTDQNDARFSACCDKKQNAGKSSSGNPSPHNARESLVDFGPILLESRVAPMSLRELQAVFGLGEKKARHYLAEIGAERVGLCYRVKLVDMPSEWLRDNRFVWSA